MEIMGWRKRYESLDIPSTSSGEYFITDFLVVRGGVSKRSGIVPPRSKQYFFRNRY